ncbi:MAG: hypothetical protein Q9193_003031 [Seirophora villosa]
MPFSEIFSDFFSSLSFQEVHAEAPQADEDSEDKGEEAGEGEDKSEGGEEGEKEEGGDDEGGEDGRDDKGADDEEEEEEEEPEDIKPRLEEGLSILVIAVTPLQVSVVSGSFENPVRDVGSAPTVWLDYDTQHMQPFRDRLNECARSSQCAPLKHHYDACAERVQQQEEDEDYKGPKEDCVEECRWCSCIFGPHVLALAEELKLEA